MRIKSMLVLGLSVMAMSCIFSSKSSSSTALSSSTNVTGLSSSGQVISSSSYFAPGAKVRLAYIYNEDSSKLASVDWSRFTHVAQFGAFGPQNDGSLYRFATYGNNVIATPWDSGSRLRTIYLNQLKGAGTKILLVIGGANAPSASITSLMDSANSVIPNTSTTYLANFEQQIVELVNGTRIQADGTIKNDVPLDGVDIDWEFPGTAAQRAALTTLISDLKSKLPNKLVTVAISYNTSYYDLAGLLKADWIGVMTYDFSLTTTNKDNGSYGNCVNYLNNLAKLGVPMSKMLLGVPLYGTVNGTQIAWSSLSTNLPANQIYVSNLDSTNAKADFVSANGMAGVMYWEGTQDAYGTSNQITAWMDARLKTHGN